MKILKKKSTLTERTKLARKCKIICDFSSSKYPSQLRDDVKKLYDKGVYNFEVEMRAEELGGITYESIN